MRVARDEAKGDDLGALLHRIRACKICRDAPEGLALPHEPRPVIVASKTARILICGQAPGTRVHASGVPFTDPSGDRLRAWMGIGPEVFYDAARIAILPMGFCFPGLDAKGGDKPPRPECAKAWRGQVMASLPQIELVLLLGKHAIHWHAPETKGLPLSACVGNWQAMIEVPARPPHFPLPHPSWRNSGWLKRNPWFDADVLPILRQYVRACL